MLLDENTGCWNWTQVKIHFGYGMIRDGGGGNQIPAHRLSYRLFIGDIPHNRYVCHKCDNPRCVNPHHLFIGTAKENMADCAAKGRTRHARGEKVNTAKLSRSEVENIRAQYRGGRSQRSLAKAFGVSKGNIWFITSMRTWRDA